MNEGAKSRFEVAVTSYDRNKNLDEIKTKRKPIIGSLINETCELTENLPYTQLYNRNQHNRLHEKRIVKTISPIIGFKKSLLQIVGAIVNE